MTYGECLCSREYAEINSFDNALSATSNNHDLPEFPQYEGRVTMFIRQQIKSRENEFLCDQINNTITCNDTQSVELRCDTSTNSLRGFMSKMSLYRSTTAIILITLTIAMIVGMSYSGRSIFCIPITLDKPKTSTFFW